MLSVVVRTAAIAAILSHGVAAFAPSSALLGVQSQLNAPEASSRRGTKLMMSVDRDVTRRMAVGAVLAAGLGLPALRVNAMTEEEELKKLQEEAARLQGLFDSQKKANEGVPGLKDAIKSSAKAGAPVDDAIVSTSKPKPSPSSPEETVKTLMGALKSNDKNDSGLKTVLDFTNPENPILQNTQFFFNQMKNSKYNVLLGNFDKFEIINSDKFTNDGKQVAIVTMKVFAPFKSMMINSVPSEYLLQTSDKNLSAVKINWQLSKDAKSGNWLSDTMYFAPPPEPQE